MNNLKTYTIIEGTVTSWTETSHEKSDGAYDLSGIKNARVMRYVQGERA